MDYEGQDVTDHDINTTERFSWYQEDKNGSFTLRYSTKRNYDEFRSSNAIPLVPIENNIFTWVENNRGQDTKRSDDTGMPGPVPIENNFFTWARDNDRRKICPNIGRSMARNLDASREIGKEVEFSGLNNSDEIEAAAISHPLTDSEGECHQIHPAIQDLGPFERHDLAPPFLAPPPFLSNYCKRRKIEKTTTDAGESLVQEDIFPEGGSFSFDADFPTNEENDSFVLNDISSSYSSSSLHKDVLLPDEENLKQENGHPIPSNFSFSLLPDTQFERSQQDIQQDKLQSRSSTPSPLQQAERNSQIDELIEDGQDSSFPSVSEDVEPGFFQLFADLLKTPNPEPSSSISRNRSQSRIPLATTTPDKLPLNILSCLERKRILISPTRPKGLTTAIQAWLDKTQAKLDPFRSSSECWFHPSPPPPRSTANGILRPYGKISKTFTWTGNLGKHSLVLNYGICAKLVSNSMSKQQSDGWVQRQWHLSHLCGNWSCINPDHTTVEAGATNVGRNNCFSHRDGCVHVPKCLKELKAALGADGKLVPRGDGVEERIRRTYYWEDWWGWDEVLERIRKGDGGMEEGGEGYMMQVDDYDDEDKDGIEIVNGGEHAFGTLN